MQKHSSIDQQAQPVANPADGDADDAIIRDKASIKAGLGRIFRELFDRDGIEPEDDFFALGGDSLLAVNLMANIEREFTSILPVSVLLDAPTIELLADRIHDDLNFVPPTLLVAAAPEGEGPPIICVHGMAGDAPFARKLPAFLSRPRPVYGLGAEGLHNGETPPITVPEIAAAYVEAIRTTLPGRPYVILGQCGTSIVAIEIIRQLQAAGDTVTGLVLLDPAVSDYVPWLVTTGMQKTLLQARASQRGQEARLEAMDDRVLSGEERRDLVKRALSGAVGSFTPKPADIDALMVCSTSRSKKLLNSVRGYPTLVRNLESHIVDCEHHDLFFDTIEGRPAKIQTTAAHINQFLDRIAPL